MRRRRWLIPVLVPLGLGLASCVEERGAGSDGPFWDAPGTPVIQLLAPGTGPFWDGLGVGMARAAEELGCQASWSGPHTGGWKEQAQLVEAAIARGVDGLAMAPVDAAQLKPWIDQAVAAGIPTITFAVDAPQSRRALFIGVDEEAAGRTAGGAAKALFPAGGRVAALAADRAAPATRERERGFRAALAGSDVELVGVLEDDGDPARARKNAAAALAGPAGADGLLGLDPHNATVMVAAADAADRFERPQLIVFDAGGESLPWLAAGSIDVAVARRPEEIGRLAVRFLCTAAEAGLAAARAALEVPPNNRLDAGVEILTPESLAGAARDE